MKTGVVKHEEFFLIGYCGLVLRGYNRERDIPDPILRKVWRYGKRISVLQQSKKR